MDKYDWLPTECADERFPMRIVRGDFIFDDQTSIYIPDDRIIDNGWGELGSIHIVGETVKPIPIKLGIAWFSYAEDAFYAAELPLPVKDLTGLFAQGFEGSDPNKKATYKYIVVGLALEGGVSLWVAGSGRVLEFAHFQANSAPVEWVDVYGNRSVSKDEFIGAAMDAPKADNNSIAFPRANGTPHGLWASYRERFDWQPEFSGSEPLQMWLRTYNGESELIDLTHAQERIARRARPKSVTLDWQSSNGRTYTADVSLNEAEVFLAFEKLTKLAPDQSLYLQFEIGDATHTIDVALRTSAHFVPFKKVDLQVNAG